MWCRRVLPRALVALAFATAVVGSPAPAAAAPPWIHDLDDVVAGHNVSVAIGVDGGWLYRHGARTPRTPASNQKLLLSMALLQRASLTTRIRTEVLATGQPSGGTLRGDIWIVGHGDPAVDAATMRSVARAIKDAGIARIRGHVMGATTGFLRDWWAPGWQDYFPRVYIPLPTALTFEGNRDGNGVHITDPERRAARSLTKRLRSAGVPVSRDAGAGPRPAGLIGIATVTSDPLEDLIRFMDRRSKNFYAEVLGKWLGGRVVGGPGSIAKGARAIELFGANHGAGIVAYDSSGLSYWNRVRPADLVRLLWFADDRPWGDELRLSLPRGGQGTLEGRLTGVTVRAKTGTLIEVSTLSGWVWLEKAGAWAEFSIMSQGMSKSEATAIEDRIVRIVGNRATP
jgi:D-alanyl-D-alanine carboxypeptidase/D-alanyl-D-alanine-endopeptidase (penicillin-binding protein 4)